MADRHQRIIFLLMGLNVAVFIGLFLAVSSNNRLAADDFHYLVKTKELGIWDSMLFYYNNWNPRWSSTLTLTSLLGLYRGSGSLMLFPIITLTLGISAIYTFIRSIASHLSLPFTRTQLAIISGHLLSVLFYGAFSKNDTWFWATVIPMYLWGSFAALLGGALLLKSKLPVVRRIFIALLFGYVGGASETVAIVTLIMLFGLGFISHRRQFLIPIDRKSLHVATIFCLVGLGIDLAGAGTHVRYDHLPHYGLGHTALTGVWNYLKFTLKEIPMKLPIIALMMMPFAYFGRRHIRFQIMTLKEVFWNNRRLWAVSDVTIVVLSFAMAFSMGETGPARAWVPLTFLVVAIATVTAYELGTWAYLRSRGRFFFIIASSQVLFLGFQLWQGTVQVKQTGAYAASVDRRMEMIEANTDSSPCIVLLKPLAAPGWLFTSEITNDTADFRNKHLKLYLSRPCDYMLEDTVATASE